MENLEELLDEVESTSVDDRDEVLERALRFYLRSPDGQYDDIAAFAIAKVIQMRREPKA